MDKIMNIVNGYKKKQENMEIKNFLIVLGIFDIMFLLLYLLMFEIIIMICFIFIMNIESLLIRKYLKNLKITKFLSCLACSYFISNQDKCISRGLDLAGDHKICNKFLFNHNLNDLNINLHNEKAILDQNKIIIRDEE